MIPAGPRIGGLFEGYGGLTESVKAVLGGTLVWYSEVEPAACRVLEHHYPDAVNLGDVTKIDWEAMVKAGNRKLTDDQSRSAVDMYEMGLSLAPIAEYFGVTRQAMWDKLRRRTQMRPQKRYGQENHFWRGGATADGRANDIVEKAVAAGRLVRPDQCETCGGSGPVYRDGRTAIQAHHCDYNKPLDVMWLCKYCHDEWHASNRAIPVEGGDANGSLADIDVLSGGFP